MSCVGFWSAFERTFLDVRVFNPNSASYSSKSLDQLYKEHENAKKRQYCDRVLNIEKGSFTPLVFTSSGGMSPECGKFHKRLALLIAEKRNESYSHVINYLRTRINFTLTKSILIAIRGVRGPIKKQYTTPVSQLSFNLVPSLDVMD